jgi:hypothetical protein
MRLLRGFSCVLSVVVLPHTAGAQPSSRPNEFSVTAGIAQVDGSGVQTTPIVSVSLAHALSSPLVVFQLGVSVVRPTEDYSRSKTTEVMPEVQFQFQRPRGAVRPYVGAGIGASFVSNSDAWGIGRMLSAGAGFRADISPLYGARAEVRARGIGSNFGRSITEATIGATRRF